jgi:hypothetical protein
MAKIVAEFDTVEKTLVVTMDGKPVNDVTGVNFMKCYDGEECMADVVTRSEDESNDLKTMVHIMASQGIKVTKAPNRDKALNTLFSKIASKLTRE